MQHGGATTYAEMDLQLFAEGKNQRMESITATKMQQNLCNVGVLHAVHVYMDTRTRTHTYSSQAKG